MADVKNIEVFFENVKLAWVFVANRDDNDKHRVTLLLDKDNRDHMDAREELFKAVDKVTDEALDKINDWKGKTPDSILNTTNGDDSDYEFEHGHWLLAASSKQDVPCVYADREPIDDKDLAREIYDGILANVYVRVYAIGGKYKGVYCSLEAIQKIDDGPKLTGGGGVDPKKVFKDVKGKTSRDTGRGRDSRDDRGSRDRDDRGSRDRDDRDRGRDSRDDRGSRDRDDRGSRDRDRDDRGRDDRGRDDRDSRDRGRDRDDDRGRDRDRDDRGSRDRDRDDRGSRDRDDDRGRRGGRDDEDDDRGGSRGRDDDYDRGRERGRDKF